MLKKMAVYLFSIAKGVKLGRNSELPISSITNMGGGVCIEKDVIIQGKVLILDNVYINRGCWLNGEIIVGANSKLGPRVVIWTDSHEYALRNLIRAQGVKKGKVEIGEDCWIGANVTIIGNVKIGNGSVVGAGSIVTKDIGCYEVWAGNPAKYIKPRN